MPARRRRFAQAAYRPCSKPRVAGADERTPEREIADAIGCVESVRPNRVRVWKEITAEARARPGRFDRPERVSRLRDEAQRLIAAEFISEVDNQGLRSELTRIDPSEEAAAAAASVPGKQPERAPAGKHMGIGSEPARIAQSEAQLGSAHVHLRRVHARAGEVRRKNEPRFARNSGVIDHGLVDRALAHVGAQVGRNLCDFRRERQLLGDWFGPRNALPVLYLRLGDVGPIRDDEHRTGHGLRPAPACGNRVRRFLLLVLPVVDEQPDRKERDRRGQGRSRSRGTA